LKTRRKKEKNSFAATVPYVKEILPSSVDAGGEFILHVAADGHKRKRMRERTFHPGVTV